MKQDKELLQLLRSINRKGYPAYKGLQGAYRFPAYVLSIDHVQGDPFASPSKLSIQVDLAAAGFPDTLIDRDNKRIALQDFLTRQFAAQVRRFTMKAEGSGKSGLISVSRCGQEVLERTACSIGKDGLCMRFEVGFPAFGRTINAPELEKILFEFLPVCAEHALFFSNLDERAVRRAVALSEEQRAIREQLKASGLVAFVADGAVLPRESGVSDRPMKAAVPFASPDTLRVTLTLPDGKPISGMGLPQGLTLVVGGGYHGKSTLLKALEAGVYDHIDGDGREYVITEDTAVKLRAEDGRCVRRVDISLFINHLPDGKDTKRFSTEDASGSTSQAAALIEGIEAGTRLLLIDEDTSATNFMLRDPLMQQVVAREKEPITSFLERVGALYQSFGVSTVLVAGSSGAFFHPADTILQMDCYRPKDITAEVKALISGQEPPKALAVTDGQRPELVRRPKKSRAREENGRGHKIKLMGRDSVSIDKETIDLRFVEQLVDSEQYLALGYITAYVTNRLADGQKPMETLVRETLALIKRDGLGAVTGAGRSGAFLAMPRAQEIFACLNRYRGLAL